MRNIAIIVVPEKPQVDVAAREIFSTELDALIPGIKGLTLHVRLMHHSIFKLYSSLSDSIV